MKRVLDDDLDVENDHVLVLDSPSPGWDPI